MKTNLSLETKFSHTPSNEFYYYNDHVCVISNEQEKYEDFDILKY